MSENQYRVISADSQCNDLSQAFYIAKYQLIIIYIRNIRNINTINNSLVLFQERLNVQKYITYQNTIKSKILLNQNGCNWILLAN